MKLTHIALALTIVLFALTGYLFYQGQLDRKRFAGIEAKLDENSQKQNVFGGRVENVEKAVGIDPAEAEEQLEREVLLTEREIISRRIDELTGGVQDGAGTLLPSDTPGPLPAIGTEGEEGLIGGVPSNLVPDDGSSSQSSPPGTRRGVLSPVGAVPELSPMQQKVKNAGSIGAVEHFDPQWAFVVMNVGSEGGLKEGDKFSVRRDHFVVGQVKVTEVKKGQAIANLIPESLEPGMNIQPGDEIIQIPLP